MKHTTKFIKHNKTKYLLLPIIVIIIASAISIYTIAFSGWDGRSGYFTGSTSWSGCGWSRGCPVLPNNNYSKWSLDRDYFRGGSSSEAKVDELIKVLRKYYNGDYDYGKTGYGKSGAAFVIKTMLGIRDYSNTITDSQWTEATIRLKDRASKGRIDWYATVYSSGIDTYIVRVGNQYDVVYDGANHSGSGFIVYNDNGSIAYRMRYYCGNPIGQMSGLPISNQWTVTTSSSANRSTATPGQTITWTHTVRNNSSYSTNTNVRYHYQNRGDWGTAIGPDKIFPSGSAPGASASFTSTYRVTQDDVGKTLCRATSAQPSAWNNSGWIESSAACVTISYNYELNPDVDLPPKDVVEPLSNINIAPTINNSGPTKSDSARWELTQIIVQPGGTIPNQSGGESTTSPCGSYYRNGTAACSNLASGNQVFNVNSTNLGNRKISIGDLEPGTKICFALSVRPYTNGNSNTWRHSAPKCVVVGKAPKVQVLGGDVLVGGLINTSLTNKSLNSSNYTFGSWAEYALFAGDRITGMSSASMFNGGLINASLCSYSSMSFTNTDSGDSNCDNNSVIGNYNSSNIDYNVAGNFMVNNSNSVISNGSLNNLQGLYRTTGNIRIDSSSISKGRWIVINAAGHNVTINGNITYTNETLNSISEIPQVIIIADSITINGGVTRVDVWLVAQNSGSGSIYTCEVSSSLTISSCNQPLTINGPVIADRLFLRRTAGSGTGLDHSGDPAEVINLPASTYLWVYYRSTIESSMQTVYLLEAPSRF